MDTNSKFSPKSCSCTQCMRGKHNAGGRFMLKADERANRHIVKQQLHKYVLGDEDVVVDTVPIGNYYD